ncbi:MAG: GNAT family N-acetyltransferase [Terracidiphilus sp.]
MNKNSWLFYSLTIPADRSVLDLPEGYVREVWRPSLLNLKARGTPSLPFVMWWIFHMLYIFPNRNYSLLLIRHNGRVVHRSVVTPRYFRFPFMAASDILVGGTWTDPKERGKGLATNALESITSDCFSGPRTCWYVVEAHNSASIRVAEKSGFTLSGTGIRTLPFRQSALGQYLQTEHVAKNMTESTAARKIF